MYALLTIEQKSTRYLVVADIVSVTRAEIIETEVNGGLWRILELLKNY